jgi:hypothetical protein
MQKTKKGLKVALAERKIAELRAQVDGLKEHVFYLMLTRKKN